MLAKRQSSRKPGRVASREFQYAIELYQKGRIDIAQTFCKATLAKQPNHFEMLYLLGVFHQRNGQSAEALKYLAAALKVEPANVLALSSLGLVHSQLGHFEEALSIYDKVLNVKSDHLQTLNNRGNVLMDLKRPEAALINYDKVIHYQPDNLSALNNRGNALRALGRPGEALVSYDRALAVDPNYVEAFNSRGNALRDLKRVKEALVSYDKALALNPVHVEALNNRGIALMELGHHAEALESYDKAIAIKPQLAEAFNNRGIALTQLNRPKEALASYDKALALKPEYAAAFNNRGNALSVLKRFDDALASFDKALMIWPAYVEAMNNRSNALLDLGRYEEALECCDRAVALLPDFAEAINNRGSALKELKHPEEALASYDRAIALNPDYAEAHNNKGVLLNELGQFEAASQAIETAIKLTPKKVRFYYNLTVCKRFTLDDPHLKAMEKLFQDIQSLSIDDQIHLHFGLGKAFADVADHNRSFRHVLEGNALKRSHINYNEPVTLETFTRTRTAFTKELIDRKKGSGDSSQVPIFILGMPRSGSSLIEQILASHPQVFGAGEVDDFPKAIRAVTEAAGGSFTPEAHSQFSGEQLQEIGAKYIDGIRSAAPAAKRITDKMPENFRLIGLIHLALPNARIIHTRRDPVDTCISCFTKLFTGNQLPYTYNLAELGRYYRAYESIMDHWRGVLPQNVMLELEYEDVVTDLEGQTRRILAHCGLEWEPRCLDFHHTRRPVRTASQVQVRQPLYKSSVGRWHTHEPFLQPLLNALSK